MSELEDKGIVRPQLMFGKVNAISANKVNFEYINLEHQATYFEGRRYGKGEVGEFVIIESQINLILGRIVEIKKDDLELSNLEIIGRIQLLGTIQMDSLIVTAGIDYYPSINDLIYSAPHNFIAEIPKRMSKINPEIELDIGSIDLDKKSCIKVTPEKLFGRHLGILGSTGGGKSYTTAKILEECLKNHPRIVLLDATGEYRDFDQEGVFHIHVGSPINPADGSKECYLPPDCFLESDFLALFEPSGKVQGPKFREAIKSLKLAKIKKDIYEYGYIHKIDNHKGDFETFYRSSDINLDDPTLAFDLHLLALQIEQECVFPDATSWFEKRQIKDSTKWGGQDGNAFSNCLSLIGRITNIIHSAPFNTIFHSISTKRSLIKTINSFTASDDKKFKLLRIDLSGIPFEYKSREIIANCIGRSLLNESRKRSFEKKPVVVFLDEAHNFIGKSIGNEDTMAKLE